MTLRRVLGERPSVTSVKGVTGHTLGAAGAIEAAITVLTLTRSLVPPTANLREAGKGIEIDLVSGDARPQSVSLAVSESIGFGGQNAALVFSAA